MTSLDTAPTLNAAQRAWITRRAKAAAARPDAGPVMIVPAVQVRGIPLPQVERAPFAPIVIPVNPVAQPKPEIAIESPICQLFVDDVSVGCGHRVFVVVMIEEKVVTLLSPSSLAVVRVDRKRFEKKADMRPRGVARHRVLAILRRNLAMIDSINSAAGAEKISDGGVHASRALQLLEGARA